MYKGSLKIAATADVVDADFLVEQDRLEVRTGEDRLGSWHISDLGAQRRGDGIHLSLDGEDVVVNVPDMDSFVSLIAPPKSRRKKSKHAKKSRQRASAEPIDRFDSNVPIDQFDRPDRSSRSDRKDRTSFLTRLAGAKVLLSAENWQRWLSDPTVKWSIASAAVVIFALLALFATNTLGMILVLFGMIALIIAALAVSDDVTAYGWVPGNLSETTLVIVGAVSMVVGGVLIVLG